MRLIYIFLLLLFLQSCSLKNPLLTEKEFAEIYLDSLKTKYPGVKFNLNDSLVITSKLNDLEYKHYLENAYDFYKNDPDSIEYIISNYVRSAKELYGPQKATNILNIIPVVKPVEYIHQINSLNKDGKMTTMVTEKYNDQLLIAYAEDSENSVKYLTTDNLNDLSINRDSLKIYALRNFDKILPNIQRQGCVYGKCWRSL